MVSEPMSFRCKIRILRVTTDPTISGRSLISFVIEESPVEAKGNSFFEKGKNAVGTTSEELPPIDSEAIATADVKFYGNPFHENYQLSNIVIP